MSTENLTDQQKAELSRMAQLEGIKHWRTKDPLYLYASTGDDWHPQRAFWATEQHRADIVAHRAAVIGR